MKNLKNNILTHIKNKKTEYIQSIDLSQFDINNCTNSYNRILLGAIFRSNNVYNFSEKQIDYIIKNTDYQLNDTYVALCWFFTCSDKTLVNSEQIHYMIDNTNLLKKNNKGLNFLDYFINNDIYLFGTSHRQKIWAAFFNETSSQETIEGNLKKILSLSNNTKKEKIPIFQQFFLDFQDKDWLLNHIVKNNTHLLQQHPIVQSYVEKKLLANNIFDNSINTSIHKI